MKHSWNNEFGNAAETADKSSSPPTMEAVLDAANVSTAWQRVRRNQGCAGVDGISIAELEPLFDQEWLRVDHSLRSGEYRPQPLLRVRLPKPAGGERLLGIPSVMDRVVQQATAQVLAPCWERHFSHHSYGYRPGRSTRMAMSAVETAINRGAEWVLHLDIENFFDSVPHGVVLEDLAAGLSDERIRVLVQRTLGGGVYENGLVRFMRVGLAQGSPLSPLLANVVLHHLDTRLETAGWEFARYADDCVLLLRDSNLGQKVREMVAQTLANLGLHLNERKTAFSRFTEARFLGFAFCRAKHGRVVRTISPEALTEAQASITRLIQTRGGNGEQVATVSAKMLRGWLAYFYTPQDETLLLELVERVKSTWQKRFPGEAVPSCLSWEALRGSNHPGERVDYSGHLHDTELFHRFSGLA